MPEPVRRRTQRSDQSQRVDTMGTNVYSAKDNKSMHKSLNGEFILYQLLTERMVDENQPLIFTQDSLVEYFEPEEKKDQDIMKEFDEEYESEKAIHWYTRETCIYRILNKALRTQDIDDIIPFRKLIKDLNKQLDEEHKLFVKQQSTPHVQVYRGQLISKDEVNRLKSAINQLISMNSFLSTSTNRKKALEFAMSRTPPNDDLTTILLEIDIDLNNVTKPFADIKRLSAFPEEEEILFMFGCIFRIDNIFYDDKVKLWMAKLSLCSNNDPDVKKFSSSLEDNLKGQNKLVTIGNYFLEILKYDEAQEHFEKIIAYNFTKDHIELAYCYHGLALVNNRKGDYDLAIFNLEVALKYLLDNPSSSNHQLVSMCYNDLGLVYSNQDNLKLALQSFDKALSMSSNNRAITYSNLGNFHFKNSNYLTALEYLEKSLDNQSKTDYALMANTYIDMGKVYTAMNQKDKASKLFDKAVEYQLKDLPPGHPDLGYTYGAIGLMYLDQNEFDKAYEYIDKAYKLQLESLPNNHPDFADTYKNFAKFYLKQDNLEKTLFYYEKALENQLKTLLKTHPSVIETYRLIGNTNWKLKNYDQASDYFQKVLTSESQRKKIGDKAISAAYQNIGDLLLDKNNDKDALEFYLKLLNNELKAKLYQDFSLVRIYKTLAEIYYKKRAYNQSLIYYNCLFDCYAQKKPFDQEIVDQIYDSIGKIYLKKHNFNKIVLPLQENFSSMTENDFIGSIHFERYHLEQAFNYFEKHLQKLLQKCTEKDPKLTKSYHILANIAFDQKHFNESLKYYLKLLKNELDRKEIDDSSLEYIYRAIATIYHHENTYSKSLYYFNRTLDCQMNNKTIKLSLIDETYSNIGQIYLSKDCFHLHWNHLNKSIKRDFTFDKFSHRKRTAYENDVQFERRHLEQALDYFEKLLHKKIKKYSLDDLYTILGYIAFEGHHYDKAISFFQTLLHRQLQQNGLINSSIAQTHFILGHIHADISQFHQALEHFRITLFIYKHVPTTDHTIISKIQRKLLHLSFPHA